MNVRGIYKSAAGRNAVEGRYRSVLQRWPVANRQIVVPTCEGDTFVVVSGETHPVPLVLFHGSGANSAMWMNDAAEWAAQYRVHAVDMIGEPGLSAPSRPPLGSTRYAAWLDDVWNHLGLEQASIVGLSLGGWLALDYAIQRPDRVASLSLLSPSGIGGQNRSFLLAAVLLLMCGSWGRRRLLRQVAGDAPMPSEVSDFVALVFRHFRPRMEPVPLRTDEELASLRMPMQVILGGRDVLLHSQETRTRVERLVPDLHLTYLENAGHILPRQSDAVLEFLGTVTRALAG